MQRKHKLALALGFLAVLGTVEFAQARIINFGGTRSAVSRACVGAGRETVTGFDGNGIGFTLCLDNVRMTSVLCDDTGSCMGTVPNASTPKPRGPRSNFEPPESLSEQSSGGVPYEQPPFDPDIDIIN